MIKDPIGGIGYGGAPRVFRGGSWVNDFARDVRSAYRDADEPDNRNFSLGFRCARVQPGGAKPSSRPAWASRWGSDLFGLYGEFDVAGIHQLMRWIPSGEFLMGSPESEHERFKDEGPQHAVEMSGFWLADTACTQKLWQAVMGKNPSYFHDDQQQPVEQVSWRDVQDFLSKINESMPSLELTLPTEAQWEYACRAGTTTPFSFGENITPEQVNYDGNYPYADGTKGLYRGKTVPVGSLPPNPWGLYEMHGNVCEWCLDGMREYER